MPKNWMLFKIFCYLQILLTAFHSVISFFGIFQHLQPALFIFSTIAYGLNFWLAAFALSLLNNLYPDKPVAGKDKKLFNRLFLVNFFLTVLLFGFVFAEIRTIRDLGKLLGLTITEIPFSFFTQLIVYVLMTVFHLIILYGLYRLRFLLYQNFMKKKFEFENQEGSGIQHHI